jgi:hypothetical protein
MFFFVDEYAVFRFLLVQFKMTQILFDQLQSKIQERDRVDACE